MGNWWGKLGDPFMTQWRNRGPLMTRWEIGPLDDAVGNWRSFDDVKRKSGPLDEAMEHFGPFDDAMGKLGTLNEATGEIGSPWMTWLGNWGLLDHARILFKGVNRAPLYFFKLMGPKLQWKIRCHASLKRWHGAPSPQWSFHFSKTVCWLPILFGVGPSVGSNFLSTTKTYGIWKGSFFLISFLFFFPFFFSFLSFFSLSLSLGGPL